MGYVFVYYAHSGFDGAHPGSSGSREELNRLQTAKYALAKVRSGRRQAIHDYCNVFLKARSEISEASRVDIPRSKVLILGCGYNYPDVVLWSTVSSDIVGVDVRKTFWRNGFRALRRDFRQRGHSLFDSLVRTVTTRGMYHSYYDHLREASGLGLDEFRQDIVPYDGVMLPFPDETFDIVCSNAVLEHVAELPVVSKELRRVTKPSGVNYHVWHNYFALSGAHVPDELATSHPWGHLLGSPEVIGWMKMIGTYLNEKLPQEIADTLSCDFVDVRVNQLDRNHRRKGLDDDFAYEGENLLTPEIEMSLSHYPKEVLLTRAYSFLGIRK